MNIGNFLREKVEGGEKIKLNELVKNEIDELKKIVKMLHEDWDNLMNSSSQEKNLKFLKMEIGAHLASMDEAREYLKNQLTKEEVAQETKVEIEELLKGGEVEKLAREYIKKQNKEIATNGF